MILSILLKGYKSYSKSTFIPISEKIEEKLSVYIGNNGVGKSAILEALDTFFNGRNWNLSRGVTKDEVFIAPIFLIEKERFNSRALNENYYEPSVVKDNITLLNHLDLLSEYFWNVKRDFNSLSGKWAHISPFFTMRDQLMKEYNQNDYYLLIMGSQYTSKDVYFSAFNEDVKKHFKREIELKNDKDYTKIFDKLKNLVTEFYSYVYLPVEQSVEEILKVEAKQMQTLMNKDVLEEIDKALTDKFSINQKERSFIAFLNDHLNDFLRGINDSIQQINNNYNYGADSFIKKNLTATDIREKILEAFFLKKSLKYKNKEIHQLSSGEQRRALIDIAYAFLSDEGSRDKEIILAIDEPEVSMSTSNCFSQFSRLEELANTFNNQILLTTHWYGSLPTISRGYLHHIHATDGDLEIRQFNFFNYFEERKYLPDDVDLKSMFDLASSILSHMKTSDNSNWIICEGSDDKLYLESILGHDSDIRILPVGGIGNVVKLFTLLSNPLSADKKETKKYKGTSKVLCLIDTDLQHLNIIGTHTANPIQLRRLQRIMDKEIKLVEPSRPGENYSKTSIEDCLDPSTYYCAIRNIIESGESEPIKEVFNQFTFNEEVLLSTVDEYNSIINPKSMEFYNNKKTIVDFITQDRNKFLIAREYKNLCSANNEINHQLKDKLTGYFKLREDAVPI